MAIEWGHCYVKMTSSCNVTLHHIRELLCGKKKKAFVLGWDRKKHPSGSLFAITQRAS